MTNDLKEREETYFQLFKSRPDATDVALRIMAALAAAPEPESIEQTMQSYVTLKQSSIDALLSVLRERKVKTRRIFP